MVIKLPEFDGYVVDVRLKQFRKIGRNNFKLEFIDFDSKKGKALLTKYKQTHF